LNQSIQITI